MKFAEAPVLRPVIVYAVVACLTVAMAPWLTGGQRPVAMLISGLALLLAVLLLWRQPGVPRLGSWPLVGAYMGLLVWSAASWFWTANRYSTVVWVMVLGLAGLAFYLSYIVSAAEQGREWLVRAYVATAAAAAAYGFWLYLTDSYDRLTSSFYWPNPMAAYLVPAILIAADRVGSRGRSRWLWLGLLLVLGTAFALTDSRATTLVLAIVVTVYLIIRRPEKRHWVLLLFSVAGMWLLAAGITEVRERAIPNVEVTTPGLRFAEAASGESRSVSDRLYYLQSAADMWRSQPIFGVGAGAYGDVHPQYQRRVVSASTNAHNFYVQTGAELGAVGAVLLVVLLTVLAWGVVRSVLADRNMRLPLALGLLGILMHMGLDIDARYPAIVLLAAVLAGMVYRQKAGPWESMSWSPIALAGVLMVPLVSLHLSAAWAERGRQSQDADEYELAAEQFATAHQWPFYNPDVIGAEGINHYSRALVDGRSRSAESALALDRARLAAAQDPADAQHRQLEARVLMLQGNFAEAERVLREALRLDSYNHPEYAYDLAAALNRLGQQETAMEVMRAMVDQYPDEVVANRSNDKQLRPALATLWSMIGEESLRLGQMREAEIASQRALKIDPKNHRALMLRSAVGAAWADAPR